MKLAIIVLCSLFIQPLYSQAKSGNYLFRPTGANFFIYGRGSSHFIINQSKLTHSRLNAITRRLASAKRIVTAADDPAGLAVAEKMKGVLQGLKQEALNAEDYRNYLRYYESMVAQNQQVLKRIRLVILRSANGILGPDDRALNQREINQLLRQINMNARFAQFNRKKVMLGLNTKFLGVDKVNVVRSPYKSLGLVDKALKKLRRIRSVAGVKSNTLTFKIKGKYVYYVNLMRAESRIRDQDMAKGISQLIKNSVMLKTQYGTLLKGKK